MLPFINAPFEYLSGAIGASPDELKLIFSFLLSYPFAGLLKRIPDAKPWQKNAFSIAISLFYLIGLFDLWDGVRTLLWSSVGTYLIAYYVDGSFMPWIVFIFLMGQMSVNHIIRQNLNSPSTVDITGAQMVTLMKLSAFAWNVHDGRLKQEELTDHQKDRAIRTMPNLLDYAGYVLFFPSLFAGPAFDFNDYRKWLETTMFDLPPGADPAKAAPTRKGRKIPRSGTPATYKAVYGLLWIGAFVVFSGWYNTDVVLSKNYMNHGLLRRIWWLHMLGLTTRLKYYGVWSLTEGACIMSGMGYNGFDAKTGKVKWDRLENVYPWGIESAQNSRAYLENWNKNTNSWLRNYVYLRVTPKGKKPGFRASLATFTTSAFWHGFYPGYYLTFILAAFIQTVAKNFRRYIRPFFLTPDGTRPTSLKPLYDILSYLATQLAFSFTVAPFVLLSFSASLTVWSRVYFYCPIGVILSILFFSSPAKAAIIKQLKKRNHPNIQRTRSQENIAMGGQGLPDDLERDVDEAVREIKAEVEARRRRGSVAPMPIGAEMKRAVEEKLGRKLQ